MVRMYSLYVTSFTPKPLGLGCSFAFFEEIILRSQQGAIWKSVMVPKMARTWKDVQK